MKVPGRRDVEEIINVKNIFLSVKIVVNFWAVERIVRLSLLCPAGVLVLSYQKTVISFMTLLRTVSTCPAHGVRGQAVSWSYPIITYFNFLEINALMEFPFGCSTTYFFTPPSSLTSFTTRPAWSNGSNCFSLKIKRKQINSTEFHE